MLFHIRNVNVNSIFIHSFGKTKFLSVCLGGRMYGYFIDIYTSQPEAELSIYIMK